MLKILYLSATALYGYIPTFKQSLHVIFDPNPSIRDSPLSRIIKDNSVALLS